MIALKITDIKDFMSRLLKDTLFDSLWLVEASITTYNTFTIDGNLHRDFFDAALTEALDKSERTHSLWREVKPYCFSIIRGKHTPLHFKIVFQISRANTRQAIADCGCMIAPDDVNGLYLNFQYNGSELICTTGTSLRIFTMDKTLDHAWDTMVLSFFRQHQISYEQL